LSGCFWQGQRVCQRIADVEADACEELGCGHLGAALGLDLEKLDWPPCTMIETPFSAMALISPGLPRLSGRC
jgi:hypothetical protein